jgi:hypothetical protein
MLIIAIAPCIRWQLISTRTLTRMKLLENGLITEAEFQTKRTQILDSI